MNKKGVSAVVANVLIVLLVVAAVSILWAVIKPTLEGAGEDIAGSTTCSQVNMEITNCEVIDDGDNSDITVFRKAGGPEKGTVIVSVEGSGNPCMGTTDAFTILSSEVINCTGNASGKSIRAGMMLENGEKICEGIAVEFVCP